MLYPAIDIASLVVFITWACINVPTYINPRFQHILFSQARLIELFDLAGFTFCPGLFDVLNAATAPSLRWFESLPDAVPTHVWGVYVLVLKKPGHTPLIYIGSGTAFYRGVRARLSEHRHNKVSPRYLKDALRQGYKITHIALLAHCPIPNASHVPILRTVLVALEAALTCTFWAMHRRNKSYGFGDIRPWPRTSFEWKGLCGHNPLVEGIYNGDFDFTPEQLEEIATAVKEKNRAYQEKYQKALRANPTEEYRARQKRNNEKQKPGTQARQQAAVANQEYYCKVCNVSCRDNASLVRHNTTTRHKKKTVQGDDDFHCSACNISFRYQSAINAHYKSKSHIYKMTMSGSRSA
jgi:hypothetical protein